MRTNKPIVLNKSAKVSMSKKTDFTVNKLHDLGTEILSMNTFVYLINNVNNEALTTGHVII